MAGLKSLVLVALVGSAQGIKMASGSTMARANPIRRVVTMLQKIQQKVEKEGEEQTELHEKFMCQCKSQTAEYTQSISDGGAKVESLAAGLETAIGQKSQLESDLKGHKSDREAAKQALADAQALREKEAAAYAGVKAESEANIAAMTKAVAAIEKGGASGGQAFLQTDAAQRLRNLAASTQEKIGDVLSFLSNEDESEGSGEITGILKQLGDEMKKDLADATKVEETAIQGYNELTAAKQAEVTTLTSAIEDKITRVGESGLNIEDIKADSKDTAEKLVDDKKFLANLKKECAKKEVDWAAISKERKAELLAIADTITMLNSDEALELFKKTLPSAASSFMQVTATSAALQKRALDTLRLAMHKGSVKVDLIALALHGRAGDFTKVLGMIDEMVSVLKGEQGDDDEKKEYCNKEIDSSEDKIKGFELDVKDASAAINDAKETVATLEKEMAALVISLQSLDIAVTASTAQRQKENSAFKDLRASNTAAMDLIEMAKKRLNKFYNPKLALLQKEEANSVIVMMDELVAELEKETTVAETDEKDAQADYETFMADSKSNRAENSKILEDKTAAKADAEGAYETHTDNMGVAQKKLRGSSDQLGVLHADCDWLLSNFDSRKEARNDEIDNLGKAKAVLSGADA